MPPHGANARSFRKQRQSLTRPGLLGQRAAVLLPLDADLSVQEELTGTAPSAVSNGTPFLLDPRGRWTADL
jgi:hypothetical protein